MIVHSHLMVCVYILCILFPWIYINRVGRTGWALWTYCLFSAASVAFDRWYNPPYLHAMFQPQMKFLAAISFGLMLAVPAVTFKLLEKNAKFIDDFFKSLLFFESLIILYCVAFEAPGRIYGVFNVGSLSAGVIAAGLPMFVHRIERPFSIKTKIIHGIGLATCTLAICLANSATAAVVTAVSASAYVLCRRKKVIDTVIMLVVCIVVFFLIQHEQLWNDSSRVVSWKNYLTWFFREGPVFFGTGVSTFEGIAPYLDNGHGTIWLWMHSDWLQIMWDAGIIGLFLSVIFYINILIGAWRRSPAIFAMAIGLGTCMLTYSPLHFVLGQVFAVYIIWLAIRYK